MKKLFYICRILLVIFTFSACGQTTAPASDPQEQSASPVYWNYDRNITTRTADENGLYHIRFVSEGKLVELKTNDQKIVNYIDTMDAMGLVLDDNQLIIDVLNVKEIAIEKVDNYCITKIDGNTISLNRYACLSSMDLVLDIQNEAYVMDVRPHSSAPGGRITLALLDRVNIYCNEDGEVIAVFLRERPEVTIS